MLRRITDYVTRKPKRVIVLWIAAVIILGGIGSSQAYRVTTDDVAGFLPEHTESAQATRFAQDAFGQQKGTHTVTALVERADGGKLNRGDRAQVARLADRLGTWRPDVDRLDGTGAGDIGARAGRMVAAAAGPVAPDRTFRLIGLQWKGNATDPVAHEAFRQLRSDTAGELRQHGLRAGYTGSVASTADYQAATEDSQATAQTLLLLAILVLTLLFFRGPLAAPPATSTIVTIGMSAAGLVVLAAIAFGFQLESTTPDLITVVLVGIGVDYFLFLLFRLRERLRAGEDRRSAAASAAASPVPRDGSPWS